MARFHTGVLAVLLVIALSSLSDAARVSSTVENRLGAQVHTETDLFVHRPSHGRHRRHAASSEPLFGSELEIATQVKHRGQEGAVSNVKVYTGDAARQQTAAFAALQAMGTVAISADADMGQEAILNLPDVKAALAAKTPDAVDKLIQGILDGTGKGGVVTSEFNQNGVHATIISNVNELRITQLDASQEQHVKKSAEQARKKAIYARDNVADS